MSEKSDAVQFEEILRDAGRKDLLVELGKHTYPDLLESMDGYEKVRHGTPELYEYFQAASFHKRANQMGAADIQRLILKNDLKLSPDDSELPYVGHEDKWVIGGGKDPATGITLRPRWVLPGERIGLNEIPLNALVHCVGFFAKPRDAKGKRFVGSGVRLAGNVVVTADHVVRKLRPADEVYIAGGDKIKKENKIPFDKTAILKAVTQYPGCNNDIAFLKLPVEVGNKLPGDASGVPLLQAPFKQNEYLGKSLVISGYGATTGEILRAEQENTPLNRLQSVLYTIRKRTFGVLPLRTQAANVKFCREREFIAGHLGLYEEGAAKGDSGGPAFIRENNGTLKLVGIVARTGQDFTRVTLTAFTDITVFTKIWEYYNQI